MSSSKYIWKILLLIAIIFSMLNTSGCSFRSPQEHPQRSIIHESKNVHSIAPVSAQHRNWEERGHIFKVDRQTSSTSVLNPYKVYSYAIKGQLHAHSKRSGRWHADFYPNEVLEKYGHLYYGFVALTDHNQRCKTCFDLFECCSLGYNTVPCSEIFQDPGDLRPLYIPSEEGGWQLAKHILQIGLTQTDPCRPSDYSSLRPLIDWVERAGGVAVAAHPLAEGSVWADADLYEIPWLRGIEINDANHVILWDQLLKGDRARWGFATDDFHREGGIDHQFVVVNSPSSNKSDILVNLRKGNFFSVRLGTPGTSHTGTFPQLHYVDIVPDSQRPGEVMIVTWFSGATEIRFIHGNGQHASSAVPPAEGMFSIQQATHPLNGSEQYVRIELRNANGTVTYSQPLFVYGHSCEDCVTVDYNRARVERWSLPGDDWTIVVHNGGLPKIIATFGSEEAAQQGLAVFRHYKMNGQCFVGRPWAKMVYFLVNGQSPVGAYPNEDCMHFEPDKIEVKLVTNSNVNPPVTSWKLVQQVNWLLDFRDSEIQARRADEFIRRHGFNRICYVGRPGGMVYFRR